MRAYVPETKEPRLVLVLVHRLEGDLGCALISLVPAIAFESDPLPASGTAFGDVSALSRSMLLLAWRTDRNIPAWRIIPVVRSHRTRNIHVVHLPRPHRAPATFTEELR